ncbi:hypothetical protein BGZ76_004065 [Entomortierella beljakovae]|nr:hypothetical protein BGZ76_004065 [Entomortierella beljakovae]
MTNVFSKAWTKIKDHDGGHGIHRHNTAEDSDATDHTPESGLANTNHRHRFRRNKDNDTNALATAFRKSLEVSTVMAPFVATEIHQLDTSSEMAVSALGISNKTSSKTKDSQLKSDASQNIFENASLPKTKLYRLPKDTESITSTPQLAYCLALLHDSIPKESLNTDESAWLNDYDKEPDEKMRFERMISDLVQAFIQEEPKTPDVLAEVVSLSAVLGQDDFRVLLNEFVDNIRRHLLLDTNLLIGLSQLLRNAPQEYLNSDDLLQILNVLHLRLQDTHHQSTSHFYQITSTVSCVLDSMVDVEIKSLSREKLHKPLSEYLDKLKGSTDPLLVYQAAYAYQALQYIPDDNTILRKVFRRTGKVVEGIAGVVSAVKALNLKGLLEGLQDIYGGIEGIKAAAIPAEYPYRQSAALMESGPSFLESLKGAFSSTNKSSWYPALRGLDLLIQEGRLFDFEKLIREAPCRCEPAFQWGVCQRLGSLMDISLWGYDVCSCALSFLGDIYKDDETWGHHIHIKQWIIYILQQLANSPDDLVVEKVQELLFELKTNGDATKQALFDTIPSNNNSSTQLLAVLPPKKSSLFYGILSRPDVETRLKELKRDRLLCQNQDVYISPRAKISLHEKDHFDLMTNVEEFLDGGRKVMLILGDSGAGKSTFNRALEISLWEKYKAGGRIPLFIYLPSIDDPGHNLVYEQLQQYDFTDDQIRELKRHREFILICDAYDEIQQIINLYEANQLNGVGDCWKVQMVISCRTEYQGSDYRDWFQPFDQYDKGMPELFQEAVIIPFNKFQINDYIDSYVTLGNSTWCPDDYKNALVQIPNLQDLVTNPFLLRLAIEVLPEIMGDTSDYSSTKITRVGLFDLFVGRLIKRGKTRFNDFKKKLSSQSQEELELLLRVGFIREGVIYLKELSAAIYDHQDGHPVISYSKHRDQEGWKHKFFSDDCRQTLLREAIPLMQIGNKYKFIHKSVLEYGLALSIFDPSECEDDNNSEMFDSMELPTMMIKKELLESPIGRKNIVSQHSVIQFLVERAQEHPIFKEQLYAFIEQSKYDDGVSTAAANAITILLKSGVQFNGADLRGIKVPKADLSNGVFDSAQMEGCDLRDANLQHIWIRSANLSNANMTGASFGELPMLEECNQINCCAYSPDGMMFVIGMGGLDSGSISLYETSTWKKLHVWKGHGTAVYSIAFSPIINQVVSAGNDNVVHLWDINDNKNIRTLEGHSNIILTITYSPNGNQIVSGSCDNTVRLWDVDTGECCYILQGHSDKVSSIAYSPKGEQIASGSWDNTIRLWDVTTGNCTNILEGHTDIVSSLSYSPKGDQLASGSYDMTSRLWDIDSWNCTHILKGHSINISQVRYSPKGDQIATSSWDNTVRIWNVNAGNCTHTLKGHSHGISSVVYSPKGDQIATGSFDNTVRLWKANASYFDNTQYHSNNVHVVIYSPKGDRIASGSRDNTIRLWNVDTGDCTQILQGHSDSVSSVIFSPRDGQIASGSWDSTVKLWNADTGQCIHTLQGHSNHVYNIDYSPKGDKIVSGSRDMTAQLWDVDTGRRIHIFHGHSDIVFSVAFSPNGTHIASGSRDNRVKLWDVDTGSCIHTLQGHSDSVQIATFSPKGDQIASGSDDSTVRLWDVTSGNCIHILQGHSRWVRSVTYSPNGYQIASAGGDKTVRLWNVVTGGCIHTLQGHNNDVHSIMYSPTGDKIASGSRDKTAMVWNIKDGACLAVIDGFCQPVSCVSWRNVLEELCLVTGSADRSVRQWRIIRSEAKYNVDLHWSSSHEGLTVLNSILDHVEGLTYFDQMLLSQHGAIIPVKQMIHITEE